MCVYMLLLILDYYRRSWIACTIVCNHACGILFCSEWGLHCLKYYARHIIMPLNLQLVLIVLIMLRNRSMAFTLQVASSYAQKDNKELMQ
jgi:hypothetical protein